MRSMPDRRWLPTLAVPLALAVTVASCSDSATDLSNGTVDMYMDGLPSWESYSPAKADADTVLESGASETDELVGGTFYECTSTPYSLTRTPEKVVTLDPDVNILWLGSLLQGSGYKGGIGSLAEWSVRERAPLRISIDLLASNNSRTVDRPDLASVNQAVGELVQAAAAEGHRGGSSVSFSMHTTYSVRQAALSLGISTMYLGPKITAELGFERTARERTVTAYFVQRMFTTSFVLPNTPSDMFSDEFTVERLQEEVDRGHVGTSNPPVYVASIVYGRVLIFTFTSTASLLDIRAALSAFVGTEGGTIDFELKRILQEADISVVTVGGEGRNAVDLIRTGHLADYFNEDAALTSARPISYTVRNLGDNSIAKVSETTEYNLKECTAVPTTGQLQVDVTPNDAMVSVVGPGGYTYGPQTGDQLLADLTPGGYTVSVARQGFDSTRVETSVNAGEVTQLPITLRDPRQNVVGGIYKVTPSRIILDNVDCAETYPDIYEDIRLGSRLLVERTRDNYVELQVGQWDHAGRGSSTWNVLQDTVFYSNSGGTVTDTVMAFQGAVWDNDGISADDLMARTNFSYYKSAVPTGTNLTRSVGVNGCQVRFEFSIAKTGDMFGP